MDSFYVYVYYKDLVPYYVGMGQGKRYMRWHKYVDVPKDMDDILIISNLTQNEAWDIEIQLIAQIGRSVLNEGPLKNLAPGGKGSKSGWHHSPETKKRISNSLKGKKKSKAHIKNMQKKRFTDEHREKIRQANIGRKKDGREIKISKTMSKKRWYTNGISTAFCEPGMEPKGFVRGRKLNVVA